MVKPHIFTRIFDFRYQRSGWQAFGFYWAHLMLYLVLSAVILGLFLATGMFGTDFYGQVQAASIFAMPLGLLHALVLTWLVIKKKHLDRRPKIVATGALAVLCGGVSPVFSLIVIGWLSTRAPAPLPETP